MLKIAKLLNGRCSALITETGKIPAPYLEVLLNFIFPKWSSQKVSAQGRTILDKAVHC